MEFVLIDRVLKSAFQHANYKYDENNIHRSIKIIQNYLYIHFPIQYREYSYEYIEKALKFYQYDRDIICRINDYISNEEIIYTDPKEIMKELNISEERYLFNIHMNLKLRELQNLEHTLK
jgi:hypothetical protein